MASARDGGCCPLHTCELCGQDGLTEADMRSHMLLQHVQTSPACPFCDLGEATLLQVVIKVIMAVNVSGDLTNSELELHVNTAHLDFLTPESEDLNYLEAGAGNSDWGSLWELDRCAGEAGLTGGVADSPEVSERQRDSERGEENPFVDSDVSDTEEDTTVCSVLERKKPFDNLDRSPEDMFSSPKRLRAGSSTCTSSPSSPRLDKSQLSLPLRPRPTGGHSPAQTGSPLCCPLCPYSHSDPDTLQAHVNSEHLDTPAAASVTCHACPLCDVTCDNVTLLEAHVNTAHADIVSPPDNHHRNKDTNSSPVCPVCGQCNWASSAALQSHVESHFSSPSPGPAPTTDQRLALQLQESELRRREEEAEFASLQAQYGMDEQGNYVQQSVNGLRKAVVSGKLSVVDYYERQHLVAQSEKSGVDDMSSATRNVTGIISRRSHNTGLAMASKMDHYASSYGDKGWGCGYRNLQMLLSCLLYSSQYRDALATKILFNRNNVTMPSISRLQKIIEDAWHQGFDRMGCEQLGGKLVNTRKWIGATEIYTFLSFCDIHCEIIDFHRPTSNDGAHPAMFQWLLDYFRGQGRASCPVYLQHQGHSRTVMGVETTGNNIKLLVLDPSHSPDSINSDNVMRMVRKTLNSMKSKQYQLVVVRGVIDRPEMRETKKVVISTRIPP